MNSVVHFEIPATELEVVRKFYANLFGWEIAEHDEANLMVMTAPSNEHGIPLKPGAINGSFYAVKSPATPCIVIEVPNVDAYLKNVVKHGGTVVTGATEIPGMGIYARFKDPDGNLGGLWQSLS